MASDDSVDQGDENSEDIKKLNSIITKIINSIAKNFDGASGDGQAHEVYSEANSSVPSPKNIQEDEHEDMARPMVIDEPLVEIITEKDTVHVFAELKGAKKHDIKIIAKPEEVSITFANDRQQYSKKINMPCLIEPDFSEANLRNGVLEIVLKRVQTSKEYTLKIT